MDENITKKCIFCKKELFKGILCPICRKKILSIIGAIILSIVITFILATIAIAYIVIPTDLINDLLPLVGLADDTFLVAVLFLTWLFYISPLIVIPIIIFKNN